MKSDENCIFIDHKYNINCSAKLYHFHRDAVLSVNDVFRSRDSFLCKQTLEGANIHRKKRKKNQRIVVSERHVRVLWQH